MKAAHNPGHHRTGRPARPLQVALAVCGVLAGFAVTLGGVAAFRNDQHAPVSGPRPAATAPVVPVAGASPAAGGSPAALDAEWRAYSGRSTCADWAGADGVSAVRLNPAQLAWFFSDTYLGPAGPGTGYSGASGFLHNSVVVQATDGRRPGFVTVTGGGACGRAGRSSVGAAAPVPVPAGGPPHQRYWNADGIAVGGFVDRFYIRYLAGGPPFVPAGTAIARFAVSQLSAAGRGPAFGAVVRPPVTVLPSYTPPVGGTPIVWGAALLRTPGVVYVYGWQSPDASLPVSQLYLARVAASRLADFSAWSFYAGGGYWAAGQASAQPVQPAGMSLPVPAGFSVVPVAGRYWLIQSAADGASPGISAYPGPTPWGPFDPGSGIVLYRSPDIGLDAAHDYRIMYEARAEPALSTSQTLVLSYNVSSVAVNAGCSWLGEVTNSVAQPRFVTVPVSAFALDGAPGRDRAVAGPSAYPAITQHDPSQWFSSWAYPGGCPPVRGLANLTVYPGPGPGTAALAWADAGLGLMYRVYERGPADAGYVRVRKVAGLGTTLTGLIRGATYRFLVVPVNVNYATGAGREVTARIP
jgi:hypothetical protein